MGALPNWVGGFFLTPRTGMSWFLCDFFKYFQLITEWPVGHLVRLEGKSPLSGVLHLQPDGVSTPAYPTSSDNGRLMSIYPGTQMFLDDLCEDVSVFPLLLGRSSVFLSIYVHHHYKAIKGYEPV